MQVTKGRSSGAIRPNRCDHPVPVKAVKGVPEVKLQEVPGLLIVEKDTADMDSCLCPLGNTKPKLEGG